MTLHVGPGTFLPVRSENIAEHHMHAERFHISPEGAEDINTARRIIAVGTTAVRTLESARCSRGAVSPWSGIQDARSASTERGDYSIGELPWRKIEPQEGQTDLFIYPPYRFRVVDVLLTNFHLPRSTLLMLVSAFAGREFVLRA